LSRDVPQMLRDPAKLHGLDQTAFGVNLVDPVDFYTMAVRATKHGILFIALTFLAVFLTENSAGARVHPAQFLLIGMAQVVFFLLLLSLAEQIGFGGAYLLAATATVGLLCYYGQSALQLGRRLWILGLTLVVLYGTLYMILKSSDYALLAGSVLAFLAVAVTMVATRNESWRAREG
jgi:inner membrane protein